MSKELIIRPMAELQVVAKAAYASGFYGFKNEQQAFAAAIASQDMGMNATRFMQDYHIISNRPAKKTEAAFRDFKKAGGRCNWLYTGEDYAEAEITAPDGDSIKMKYTVEQAQKAGLFKSGSNWEKNTADMLRSRVLSKGIKAVYPEAYDSFLSIDEATDIEFEQPQEQPKQEEQVTEAELEPNIDDLKKSLTRTLQKDFSFTGAMIKEFADANDLSSNEELLSELVSDNDKLINYIDAFEKGL